MEAVVGHRPPGFVLCHTGVGAIVSQAGVGDDHLTTDSLDSLELLDYPHPGPSLFDWFVVEVPGDVTGRVRNNTADNGNVLLVIDREVHRGWGNTGNTGKL